MIPNNILSQSYNPYFQTVNDYIPYQQSIPNVAPQAKPSIPGRKIENIESVVANEVPMDGSISIFPLINEKEIYTKKWGSDGLIKTKHYILDESSENSHTDESPIEMICKRLDKIENLLTKPTNRNSSKKEEQ